MAVGMLERYQKLGLRESLSRRYDYPWACKELSFILREAYGKAPKNLQSLLFQDTLAAFRLLPDVQTSCGLSAANLLLQAAEVALPKQKRALAATEFKHAVVAHKRRKSRQDGEGSLQLPQDVLIHVFNFLDLRSLVSVGLVCWSWNSAATDNKLWQSQYSLLFGNSNPCHETKDQSSKPFSDKKNVVYHEEKEGIDPRANFDWREAFKKTYIGNSSWRATSNRGYCGHCKSVIWLSNIKCANLHHRLTNDNHQWKIKPVSPHQVVEYLLGQSLSTDSSSSDSDSDSEQQRLPKLWAYPRRHISGIMKQPSVRTLL